ncbi:uncharacterized protein [Nicotiana sylvestris]|uniref:Uncharacterized protein n=2 Tax=Nicotiana TaxID=4085 RepID=A0A1S4C2J3_TOBAC|nr:PREDICTED: uncharacterized protein LOC104221539 [Nicotiana sylvestris]XP_016495279.1 PREDICTED: uncharacterized protein LOC107814382 [Nicotiana tabacum]
MKELKVAEEEKAREKLKGGPVSDVEVFAETHKKKKKDGSREGWVETRASEQYDGYHRSLDEWCQMQPTSDDGTRIQPSPRCYDFNMDGCSRRCIQRKSLRAWSTTVFLFSFIAISFGCSYYAKSGRNGSNAKEY